MAKIKDKMIPIRGTKRKSSLLEMGEVFQWGDAMAFKEEGGMYYYWRWKSPEDNMFDFNRCKVYRTQEEFYLLAGTEI